MDYLNHIYCHSKCRSSLCAKIDLVDINLNDYNICVDKLEKINLFKKKQLFTKSINRSSFGYYPADLKK